MPHLRYATTLERFDYVLIVSIAIAKSQGIHSFLYYSKMIQESEVIERLEVKKLLYPDFSYKLEQVSETAGIVIIRQNKKP